MELWKSCTVWSFQFESSYLISIVAPPNPEGYTVREQNETSVTLQWNKVGNNSFVLHYIHGEINISAPNGDGPVYYTVSNLTPRVNYTFILFSVFENVRSSGLHRIVFTGETLNFSPVFFYLCSVIIVQEKVSVHVYIFFFSIWTTNHLLSNHLWRCIPHNESNS